MGLAGRKCLVCPVGATARRANAAVEWAKPAEGDYTSSVFGIPIAEIWKHPSSDISNSSMILRSWH